MATFLLDQSTWDYCLDASGNIAVALSPYAEAQDAASAIKTFLGECWFDTTVGVPYMQQIFSKTFPLTLLKQQLILAALTVANVASAQVFITSIGKRLIGGQVQIVTAGGQTAASQFTAINPQGSG